MTGGDDANAARLRALEDWAQNNREELAEVPMNALAPGPGGAAAEAVFEIEETQRQAKAEKDQTQYFNGQQLQHEHKARQDDEDERRDREHQRALEAYERSLAEIRDRADRLLARLEDQERDIRRKQAEAEARAIVLHDGRKVLVGHNGDLVDKDSGRTLEGADKAEAQKKQKGDSETVAEDKHWRETLDRNLDAQKAAREAKEMATKGTQNVTKQDLEQQQQTLSDAERMANMIDVRDFRHDPKSDSQMLENTDVLADLGLGTENVRTTSFAATLDGEDRRVITGTYNAASTGKNVKTASLVADSAYVTNPNKNQIIQPNQ